MPRRRHLLAIVHGEYPADVRVAREVGVALADGFAVDVLATRGANEAAREHVDGAAVHRLPVERRRGAARLRFFGEYLAFAGLAAVQAAVLSVRHRPDVVHVHNPPDFLIVAALPAKALGARVVFDVHDRSPDMFAMRFGDGLAARTARRALAAIERLACRIADVVVTVHEPYREELVRAGVDGQKVVVVLNSVDEAQLPASPRPPARDPFRIVYHGTVTPHYGLEVLLDAFAELSGQLEDARLEIFGSGDAVPGLRARAAALGVDGRLELSGVALPHREVLERVQGASVGVVPNLPSALNRFALSTKLFEYVALGIPVVAADLPTLGAHFSTDEVAYFRAGDSRSLAGALASVAGDYASALARARSATDRYRRSYAWGLQSARLSQTLEAR